MENRGKASRQKLIQEMRTRDSRVEACEKEMKDVESVELVSVPVGSVQTTLVKSGCVIYSPARELVQFCLFNSKGEDVKLDKRSLDRLNRGFARINQFRAKNQVAEAKRVFHNIMNSFVKSDLSVYVNIEGIAPVVLSEKFMIEDLNNRPIVTIPSDETDIDETVETGKDTDTNSPEEDNVTWAIPTKSLLLLAFLMAIVAVAASVYIYQTKSEETEL